MWYTVPWGGGGAVIALNGQEGRRVDPEDPPLPCPQTQDKMGAGDLEFIDTHSLLHDGMRKLEMEQDPKSLPSPIISSACLLSVENFSQRISLIRDTRNEETKENSKGDQIIMWSLSRVKGLYFFLEGYS